MTKRLDLTNKRFGQLIALNFYSYWNKRSYWRCICDCGQECIVATQELMRDDTKSCGCLLKLYWKKRGRRPNSLPPGEYLINRVYGNYRRRAVKKNLQLELTRDKFKELIFQNCHYCGRLKTQTVDYSTLNIGILNYNGIDRKDPDIGYTIDNSITCCKICNYAKRELSYQEFIEYLKDLVIFRKDM